MHDSIGLNDSQYRRMMALVDTMNEATRRLDNILVKVNKIDSSRESLAQLPAVALLLANRRRKKTVSVLAIFTIVVLLVLVFGSGLHTHKGFARTWLRWHRQDLGNQMCIIPMPDQLTKAFRPPEDCSICINLNDIEKVASILPSQFEEKYAYSGRPVVITDGQDNWTAQQIFSFEFFKAIYGDSSPSCQFFPYATEFTKLSQVFNMSRDRANLRDGTQPWYVGWSNCDDQVARVLRQHYGRPYFLPETAEGRKIDWIFMGSTGYGAHMHVDNVEHPSWQAQLRGRKKWVLEPPPECYYHCQRLQVIVEPGEIIVLDTNRWYHQTVIVSEDLSLTIGAEYD